MANIVEGGKTPVLPPHRLREIGVKLAIYHPMLFASIRAMQDSLRALRSDASERMPPSASFDDLKRIAGLPEYDAMSARYATPT
jgi:2-methylisocitrate lyase-like PEP mutase family enzyme